MVLMHSEWCMFVAYLRCIIKMREASRGRASTTAAAGGGRLSKKKSMTRTVNDIEGDRGIPWVCVDLPEFAGFKQPISALQAECQADSAAREAEMLQQAQQTEKRLWFYHGYLFGSGSWYFYDKLTIVYLIFFWGFLFLSHLFGRFSLLFGDCCVFCWHRMYLSSLGFAQTLGSFWLQHCRPWAIS